MRHYEFTRVLAEATTQPINKQQAEQELRKIGYEDLKPSGNIIKVLVQIPDGAKAGEYRKQILNDILVRFKNQLPEYKPQFLNDPRLGSLGGIVFAGSPVAIQVKDSGKQGAASAGMGNEIELASLLESIIQKYKSVNVTFVDERGKKLSIKNATRVESTGKDVKGRKKADIVIYGSKTSLPISVKELSAQVWESADNLFGARAREIILKLQKQGVIQLEKIAERRTRTGESIPVYKLSKEVVMEPTEEEALETIFGSDLNPEGGIVIQDFTPDHFEQKGNNVTVKCHAVIQSSADIPDSHMMVWLIRNDSNRNSTALGIPGLRPLGVTLQRGIGRKGTKDVVLVDKNGNVIKNPNV
jgi:hypothetical protein